MPTKYVVCLCGAPGAGKSTFARRLLEYMLCPHNPSLQPVVVSYDEVAKDYIGRMSFKDIRIITLDMIERMLDPSDDRYNVIVLDDTMHYHSMRREVYARVRDAHAVMRTVWLSCDMSTSIERDRCRESSLGEETVRKVHSMFEPPRNENVWERDFITVDTTSDKSIIDGIIFICEDAIDIVEKEVPSVQVVETAHRPTLGIGEADTLLRKCVSTTIKVLKDTLTKMGQSLPKELIDVVNKVKASALPRVRGALLAASTEEAPEAADEGINIFSSEQKFSAFVNMTFYSVLCETLPEMLAGIEGGSVGGPETFADAADSIMEALGKAFLSCNTINES